MAELTDQDLDRIVADIHERGGVSAFKLLRSLSEEERTRLTEALAQRGIERSSKHFRLDPVEQIGRLVKREQIVKINRDTLVGVDDAAEKNRHVKRALAAGVIVEVNARPPFVKKGARGPFYAAPSEAIPRSELDPFFARFGELREMLDAFKRRKKLPAYRGNVHAIRQALDAVTGALVEGLGETILEATDEEVDAAVDRVVEEVVAPRPEPPVSPSVAEASVEESPASDDLPPPLEVAATSGGGASDDDDTPIIEVGGGDVAPPRPVAAPPVDDDETPIIEVADPDAPLPSEADVAVAVDDLFAGTLDEAGPAGDLPARLLAFVREQHDHGMLIVSTAELVRSFAGEVSPPQVHAALFAASEAGEVELRPEHDLTALTREEAELCPRDADGVALTYVRSLR